MIGIYRERNKGAMLGAAGSDEARKRLLLKNRVTNHSMKKNIGK